MNPITVHALCSSDCELECCESGDGTDGGSDGGSVSDRVMGEGLMMGREMMDLVVGLIV